MNNFRLVEGVLHAHAPGGGVGDHIGVLAFSAAGVLVGLAIPFLYPGGGAATRGRHWFYRAAAVVAGSLALCAFVYPVVKILVTHEH